MSHISGKQLLLASAAAITTLSLAATWYHAGHMTEGGAYTLLGTFMASLATVTLFVLLLIFGCYLAFIALFAILQQMNVPTMDDFIDWLDNHIKYERMDGHTVPPRAIPGTLCLPRLDYLEWHLPAYSPCWRKSPLPQY